MPPGIGRGRAVFFTVMDSGQLHMIPTLFLVLVHSAGLQHVILSHYLSNILFKNAVYVRLCMCVFWPSCMFIR